VLSAYWGLSAVHDGVSVAKAGVLISLGGLLAATARVFSGVGASRAGSREFTISGASLVLGSTGLLFMAVGTPAAAVVALVVGFGIGWSWNGVAAAGLVRLCRERLGLAASVEQVSRQAGNLVAPLFFIWLRNGFGQRSAWLFSAVGCAVAGGLLILAGRTGRLRPVLAVGD
jgi:predicted MFS family arabinose efflux permease